MSEGKRVKEDQADAESMKLFRCRYCKKCIQGLQNFVDHKRKNHPEETQQLKQSQTRSSSTSDTHPPVTKPESDLESASTLSHYDTARPPQRNLVSDSFLQLKAVSPLTKLKHSHETTDHHWNISLLQRATIDASDDSTSIIHVEPDTEVCSPPTLYETTGGVAVQNKIEPAEEYPEDKTESCNIVKIDPSDFSNSFQSQPFETSSTREHEPEIPGSFKSQSVDQTIPLDPSQSHAVRQPGSSEPHCSPTFNYQYQYRSQRLDDNNHVVRHAGSPEIHCRSTLNYQYQWHTPGLSQSTAPKFSTSPLPISEGWNIPVVAFDTPATLPEKTSSGPIAESPLHIVSDSLQSTNQESSRPHSHHDESLKFESGLSQIYIGQTSHSTPGQGGGKCELYDFSDLDAIKNAAKKIKVSDGPDIPGKAAGYDALVSEYLFYRNHKETSSDSGPSSPQSGDLVIDESVVPHDSEEASSPINFNVSTPPSCNNTSSVAHPQSQLWQARQATIPTFQTENYFCHHCGKEFQEIMEKSLHEHITHEDPTSLLQLGWNHQKSSIIPTSASSTSRLSPLKDPNFSDKVSILNPNSSHANSIQSDTSTSSSLNMHQSLPFQPEGPVGHAVQKYILNFPELSEQQSVSKVLALRPIFSMQASFQQQQEQAGGQPETVQPQCDTLNSPTQPNPLVVLLPPSVSPPNPKLSIIHHRPETTVFTIHPCNHCGKSYSSKSNLQNHLRLIHQVLAPSDPDLLGKRKTSEENLSTTQSHQNLVLSSYAGTTLGKATSSPRCNSCNVYFDTKEEFDLHKNLHRVKQYTCKYCPASFAMLQSLQGHHRAHEEKVIKCEICNNGIVQNMWQRHREICERMLQNAIQKRANHVTINFDKAVIIHHQYSTQPKFSPLTQASHSSMSAENKN